MSITSSKFIRFKNTAARKRGKPTAKEHPILSPVTPETKQLPTSFPWDASSAGEKQLGTPKRNRHQILVGLRTASGRPTFWQYERPPKKKLQLIYNFLSDEFLSMIFNLVIYPKKFLKSSHFIKPIVDSNAFFAEAEGQPKLPELAAVVNARAT